LPITESWRSIAEGACIYGPFVYRSRTEAPLVNKGLITRNIGWLASALVPVLKQSQEIHEAKDLAIVTIKRDDGIIT
jgi:hypothetical protein